MNIMPLKIYGKQEGKNTKRKVMRWDILSGLCLINGYRNGAELGVSSGRTTMFLCATMHDMRMTAVDTWAERPENHAPGQQDYVAWPHSESLTRLELFNAQIFNNRINIIRSDTADAAKNFDDGEFDFVFVDADHSFEGAQRDIEAWLPKIRSGGMIAGHDFNWPTVRDAVNTFGFENIAVFSDNVWVHQIK